MADRTLSRSRRQFLFAAGAAGIGAAIAGRAGASSATTRPARSINQREGYRLTAHIGKYYRTAKF